jgi:hypothetical protein
MLCEASEVRSPPFCAMATSHRCAPSLLSRKGHEVGEVDPSRRMSAMKSPSVLFPHKRWRREIIALAAKGFFRASGCTLRRKQGVPSAGVAVGAKYVKVMERSTALVVRLFCSFPSCRSDRPSRRARVEQKMSNRLSLVRRCGFIGRSPFPLYRSDLMQSPRRSINSLRPVLTTKVDDIARSGATLLSSLARHSMWVRISVLGEYGARTSGQANDDRRVDTQTGYGDHLLAPCQQGWTSAVYVHTAEAILWRMCRDVNKNI